MRLIGAFGLARQMTFCVGVRFCPRPAGRGRSGAREVGDDGEQLRNIDAQWIKYVQMSDGRDTADARSRPNKDGCLSNRVPTGAGEMDAVGFVVDLLAVGHDGVVDRGLRCVEVGPAGHRAPAPMR